MTGLSPFRACSTWITKAVDDDQRIIEGVASSSATDNAGDQLLSRGAVFKLPMPLLMQHDRDRPVGDVIVARASDTEITVRAQIARDTGLAYVEDAWKQIRGGLVKGLSIGAQPLKAEPIMDKAGQMTGVRYTAWRWMELSAVTLPMNMDATIDVIRAFDPWGAAAFSRPELRHEGDDGPEPVGHDYLTTRPRAIAALTAASRALLHRG